MTKVSDCTQCLKPGKCCSFFPFLSNHRVARILIEESSWQGFFEDKVRSREYLLPIGLCPPTQYVAEYNRAGEGSESGKPHLKCPFFGVEQGRCEIWQYRPLECRQYYCEEYNSEKTGPLETWSSELEKAASLMLELGYLWSEVERNLTYIDGTGKIADCLGRDEYLDLWGDYAGSEMRYFTRVGELAKCFFADT